MFPHAQIQWEQWSPSSPIRSVLVLDHVLLRQGLKRLLEDEPDVEVVAEASNAAEALQCVYDLRPEVVIADSRTFGLADVDVERLLLRESPHSKILFLSTNEDGETHASEVGANGPRYTVRHTSAEQLLEMVRFVCHRANRNRKESSAEESEWTSHDEPARPRDLTPREREVVKLLAEGRTVRSTASVLGLSVKTVDAHKFNLMRKLGLHNKAELVMWAIQQKMVDVPASMQAAAGSSR